MRAEAISAVSRLCRVGSGWARLAGRFAAGLAVAAAVGAQPAPADDSYALDANMPARGDDGIRWPVETKGLIYRWETGDKPRVAYTPLMMTAFSHWMTLRGCARYDRNCAMVISDGSCLAGGCGGPISMACRKSGQFAVEAWIAPAGRAAKPATIVTLGEDKQQANLELYQKGWDVWLVLPKVRGGTLERRIISLEPNAPAHVVVSFDGREASACCNGDIVWSAALGADVRGWKRRELIFGQDADGGRQWEGTIEGVAIYARAVGAEEARRNFQAYSAKVAKRPAAAVFAVEAVLLAKSRPFTIQQIQPYSRALVVHEYRVTKVPGARDGPKVGQVIHVAHWSIMASRHLPVENARVGAACRLLLEPFDAQPQLGAVKRSETLKVEGAAPLFYDAAPPGRAVAVPAARP